MYSKKYDNKFFLPSDALLKVFDLSNEKTIRLIPRQYSIALFEHFAKFELGVYAICRSDLRYSMVTIQFECNDKKCGKRFKISCKKSSVKVGVDLGFDVESEEKECNHEFEPPRNTFFAGTKREELKEQLRLKPINRVFKEMVEKDKIENVTKGVTGMMSCVLKFVNNPLKPFRIFRNCNKSRDEERQKRNSFRKRSS